MNKAVALFDMDGTLSRGHIWEGVRRYYVEHEKRKIPAIWAFLVTHLVLWLLAKYGLFDKERCMVKWGEDLSGIFRGASEEEIAKISHWVMDNYIGELLRDDVVDIVNQHKQSGHVVMIVSATIRNLLEVVGQRLDVPNVIGTELEMTGAKYTGKIVKPLCFGEEKVKLVEEFIGRNGLDVDFASSFAYGDSVFDLPLLKMVGHPVATYPDEDLRREAERNGWRVLP